MVGCDTYDDLVPFPGALDFFATFVLEPRLALRSCPELEMELVLFRLELILPLDGFELALEVEELESLRMVPETKFWILADLGCNLDKFGDDAKSLDFAEFKLELDDFTGLDSLSFAIVGSERYMFVDMTYRVGIDFRQWCLRW